MHPKKKRDARGRPKGHSTPSIRRAAKTNGRRRQQEKLPEDLLSELGNPPTDPLLKTEWWNRLLEVLQYGVLKGKPWVTMLRDARANALVASKLVPEEIKARAAAIVQRDDEESSEDASPRTTPREGDRIARANAGALRRDPS